MDVTAINNFHAVDRFLSNPGSDAAVLIHEAGHEKTRILLRRAAGESNVWLFEQWEWFQLGLGLALVLVLIFGPRLGAKPPKLVLLLCLLMLAIIFADRLFLTPNIARLGRVIDFLPPGPTLPERKTFGMYHGISSSLELVKLGLGIVAAGLLLVRRRPNANAFARDQNSFEQGQLPRKSRREIAGQNG